MRTSLTVTATLLTGLALTVTAMVRRVHRLEKELEHRWASYDAGPVQLAIDLRGTPIQVDYIAKEVRIHYICQT